MEFRFLENDFMNADTVIPVQARFRTASIEHGFAFLQGTFVAQSPSFPRKRESMRPKSNTMAHGRGTP